MRTTDYSHQNVCRNGASGRKKIHKHKEINQWFLAKETGDRIDLVSLEVTERKSKRTKQKDSENQTCFGNPMRLREATEGDLGRALL